MVEYSKSEVPEFFTKETLRQDIQEALALLESHLIHMTFGRKWTDEPIARNRQWYVDSLPVTYLASAFMALYDYAFAAEWDWSKNGHIFDAQQDAETFMYHAKFLEDLDSESYKRIRHVSQVARARARFDSISNPAISIEEPITPEDVALLAHMSIASVRNAISRSELKTYLEDDGRQCVADASLLEWLPSRKGFRSTMFMGDYADYRGFKPVSQQNRNTVTVPIDREGRPFRPSLKRKKGYQIGPKGRECYISDFEEALDTLKRAESPYWRRPNSNGIYGIVKGVGWKEYSIDELYSLD
ncbi:hypothetical protein J2T55_000178 [Methylohalomonas lacus]|uniref:Uncharacterized protein n=1 Tax=Methylohalomonas lacus TaxID=398773 RepID=A0AAE3L0U5_9GAMM|nr:hypothetical protein [Methylohalomonas lacus]MCS3902186.1 hypothetical protein [Methylohalomonas lacus]